MSITGRRHVPTPALRVTVELGGYSARVDVPVLTPEAMSAALDFVLDATEVLLEAATGSTHDADHDAH